MATLFKKEVVLIKQIGNKDKLIKWLVDQDKDVLFEIEEHKERKHRSLNANNYVWQLIQQIANKLGSTKEEIYRQAILDKGVFEIVPVKDEVVDMFVKSWEKDGLGNICEIKGKSKIEGYTNIICYFGSSSYDTKQFYNFAEYIVSEAKELDIETMTPEGIMIMEII